MQWRLSGWAPANTDVRWVLPLIWVLLGAVAFVWALGRFGLHAESASAVQWVGAERRFANEVDWQPLEALPDHWRAQGRSGTGTAHYRFSFHLDGTSATASHDQGWTVLIGALSQEHRVILNGRLLQDSRSRPDALGEPAPALINIPGRTLLAGVNTLEVQVQARSRGGISQPVVAPRDTLARTYQLNRTVQVFLPLVLNLAGVTFSLFIIALWRARPQERSAGLFGVLNLVVSVRNCVYYLPNELNLPHALSSWLFFVAHVVSPCLLGWFMLALTRTRAPVLQHAFTAVLIGFPSLAAVSVWFDEDLRMTRNLLQPVLILMVFPSLWMMWLFVRKQPARSLVGLMGGLVVIAIAGVHDYVGARVIQHPEYWNWMPWAVPLATPGFAMLLVDRIARAFNDLEHLNTSLEQQVATRTHELAQANLAKSRFLAAASHDLRQPVAAIGLMTELLRRRVSAPELTVLTDRLSSAVVSMEDQLKGLLDLSRLDAGDVAVRPRHVALQPLLQAILDHEQVNARDKGLSLRVHVGAQVAWADPVLLEQVLRNLVGNAVRHTREGGVLIGVRPRGANLRVDVWDTGPGIAEADRQRVFDEFVQLDQPQPGAGRGLGLGLAIARRAAELMQCQLTLRSRVQHGSCFSLLVPNGQAVADPTPVQAPAAAGQQVAAEAAATGQRILLVEDELSLRQALTWILESWGWEVEAHGSLSALRAEARGPWRLLVTDHRLSDGSGREAIQWARGRQPDLPAMVITGDTAPEHLRELAALGVPVLHKPFRPEKMRAMVDETMALSQRDDSV